MATHAHRIRQSASLQRILTITCGSLIVVSLATAWLVPTCGSAADPKSAAAAKPLSAADEAAVAEHLKEAFEDGFIVGPKRAADAQKHLAQARKVAPGDPRIDYAYGLILVKQSQVKLAATQFESAAKQDAGRFWPAWQAAIWGHLVDKQYEAGLKRLDEYAEVVKAAEKPDEISEAQRSAARWIGQMIESLSRCADSKKVHDLLAEHEVKLLDTFGDDLSAAVEAGREAIREREFELDQASGSARAAAARKKQLRNEDKASKIEKDIEGIGKEKENAKKTAEEAKKQIEEYLAKSDKALGQLEKDYQFLNQRAQSIYQSYTLAGTQLTAMQLSMTPQALKNMGPLGAGQMQQQYLQVQNQMMSYQLEYNSTLGRMSEVADRGSAAMQQRMAAIKQYESDTGDLLKKNADLDKWASRLKDQKQKLTADNLPAKGTKKAAPDKKQPITLKTFLPLDLEGEKAHLLASFAPPVQGSGDAADPPAKK